MQSIKNKLAALSATLILSSLAQADSFTLTSTDISHGDFMDKVHEYQGFGCDGGDLSPHLSWENAPEGTEAFAVLAYDPDAPTGSGWWHWQIVNIPKNVTSLAAGAGNPSKDLAPEGSMQTTNDYGATGFGGACPPPDDGAHRYQFTVHALSQNLELPEDPSGALTGYMVNAYSLASSTIEALYKR